MDKLHCYLYFPENSKHINIENAQEGEKLLEKIAMLIDRIDCEKGTNLYYMDSNLQKFWEQLKLVEDIGLEGLTFGVLEAETAVEYLLRDALAHNIEEKPLVSDSNFYGVWDLNSENLIKDFPILLKDMVERVPMLSTKESALLIKILDFPFEFVYDQNKHFVSILKDERENEEFPILCKLFFVKDFTELESWLQTHQNPRNANLTDERHQEWSSKCKKESPLLYDLRRQKDQEKVQQLLQTALTDQRSSERASKDLINWDSEKGYYIWFEFEGNNPQNAYHAYHLAKYKTHETDEKAISKIPERVKILLAYRQEL